MALSIEIVVSVIIPLERPKSSMAIVPIVLYRLSSFVALLNSFDQCCWIFCQNCPEAIYPTLSL